MLESMHQFQEIKICKARDKCGPAKAIHFGNADAFTACQDCCDSHSNCGRRRGSAAPALSQRHRRGGQLQLCAAVRGEHNQRGKQIAANAWPNSASACLLMVDKKNACGARPITARTIDIVVALKRLGSRLPSSFLFVGRVQPSPSSTTSTLVLARQTITISPSALGLLF